MRARDVALALNMGVQYQCSINKIGESHKCNQGCGEGWCGRNEDIHQQKLLRLMGVENKDLERI